MIDDKERQRRLKISQTLRGRAPWNKGVKAWRITSAETRMKIGLAHKGKKVIVSKATRLKISNSLKGRIPLNLSYLHSIPRSEEHKRKIGIAHKGMRHTEGTKRKISEAKRSSLTPLYKAIRRCYKSRQWREDIFRRDNFTCVLCHKIGNELNADHFPRRFVDIVKASHTKTIEEALLNNELWDIKNGRTLCLKCHEKTETWGNKFNSKNKVIKVTA